MMLDVPKIGKEKLDIEPEYAPNAVYFVDLLDGQCRWPVSGRGYDMVCCGEWTQRDKPYCPHHMRRAYHR